MNSNQMNEIEQKLRLSVANIIAICVLMLSVFGSIVGLIITQTKHGEAITELQKNREETKNDFEKFNLKMDKVLENVTQMRLESADQRVKDAENKLKINDR